MASTPECAAWKVLYYARLYSGNKVNNIAANMNSIRVGYPSAMNSMAASMSSCDKCATAACENLAKQVAHAWLKAFKIPETGGAPAASKPQPIVRNIDDNTAAGLIMNKVYDICLFNGVASSSALRNDLTVVKSGWPSAISAIKTAGARGNDVGIVSAVNGAASAFTKAYGCQNIYDGTVFPKSGGGTTPKTAPKGTTVDSDCTNYGGEWLGGLLDGACVSVKKLTKGAEAGVQNPLTQYLPIMLIGMGFLAILMLAKK